ncbi:MAG: hypothetical protein ACI9BF_000275 [Candidatus Paceibacteria bacterium]|jgi:hypothetical protein
MEKLTIKLENCYGIKKLEHEFDFSNFKTTVVYAGNGIMKTSFAKTFDDLATNKKPHDQLDDSLIPTSDALDESGAQINPEHILVIKPYSEEVFNSGEKILTLLANKETREEYLAIYKEIESLKKAVLPGLKKISGSSNYEEEILSTFSHLEKQNIFEVFDQIIPQIKSSKDTFNFKYNEVFDKGGKVKEFVGNKYDLLTQYLEKYNSLITESSFFTKDESNIFGTTEAKDLNNSLGGNEYFVAGHGLLLKSHGTISSKEKLNDIIEEEIAKVFNNDDLKQLFKEIDDALEKNKDLVAFKKVIEKDPSILLRLSDYEVFRQEAWYSFLKKIEVGLEQLIELYNSKKPDLEAIIQRAKDGQSAWEAAIDEFDNRFVGMPFALRINNKADAVLNEQTPAIDFFCGDKKIDRKKLLDNVLSQGERRALYLLNVIFEIKSRQMKGQVTLFVIDDIADSFDYKNKYAIVEYLKDLSDEGNFYSIILTHNFDFFRTLHLRILHGQHRGTHSLIAEKLTNEIKLIPAEERDVIAPFENWRQGVNDNERHLIACIPFVRNLIEFKDGQDDNYKWLTHLLHIKTQNETVKATSDITIADLQTPFQNVLSDVAFTFTDANRKLVDVIEEQIAAIKLEDSTDSITLENKIILAIGIRLKAEEYMWLKVTDQDPVNGSQTGKLFGRFKRDFKDNEVYKESIKTLESVNIMTPENIHLNSFMYEPILDMGIDELKNLHSNVCELLTNC